MCNENSCADNPKNCFCVTAQSCFLSKKKKVEYLKQTLSKVEQKAEDIKEYIKEIESSK